MAIPALNVQNLTQAVAGLQQAVATLQKGAPAAAQPGFNLKDLFQRAAAAAPQAAKPAAQPAQQKPAQQANPMKPK